jgi:hypothetical protein
MSKVENFPKGIKIKIGDRFGHLIVVDIILRKCKHTLYILECDCKNENRNRIQIERGALNHRPILYCNFNDCKYSIANSITINDQEYSLMPGSIIGWLEIGERVYDHDGPYYKLLIRCIGSCNSNWVEIRKHNLLNKLYYDCENSSCSSQSNRLENESLYIKWGITKQRVFNPNNIGFNSYDELIIGPKMEPEWVNDYKAYESYVNTLSPTKKEMQLLNPDKRISIDRKDNDYGYIKGNLRWSTPEMQQQNRRNTILSITVINIRIDFEINKLTYQQLEIKYDIIYMVIWNITNYKRYPNISIQKYIDEYNLSKTICGYSLAEIEAKGGLTEEDINK